MVAEKASELALAHAQSACQIVNVRVVEGAELDQGQCPRDSVRGAAPSTEIGCSFRPAAQTWPETRFLSGSSGGIKRHIRRSRRAGRTDRAAVDAGGLDAGEEPAIKAGVTLADSAIAGVMIEIHGHKMGGEAPVV